ncbi:unnamed protein product [Trichogramma brassicae]|uniref:Uncharacterized protein n=1 Tax=Trichogramma brassicae TaxID=86971 RepID=A0A6H5HXV2_9HYME|nr:unnamed protein product [Trichogramma brassicae]
MHAAAAAASATEHRVQCDRCGGWALPIQQRDDAFQILQISSEPAAGQSTPTGSHLRGGSRQSSSLQSSPPSRRYRVQFDLDCKIYDEDDEENDQIDVVSIESEIVDVETYEDKEKKSSSEDGLWLKNFCLDYEPVIRRSRGRRRRRQNNNIKDGQADKENLSFYFTRSSYSPQIRIVSREFNFDNSTRKPLKPCKTFKNFYARFTGAWACIHTHTHTQQTVVVNYCDHVISHRSHVSLHRSAIYRMLPAKNPRRIVIMQAARPPASASSSSVALYIQRAGGYDVAVFKEESTPIKLQSVAASSLSSLTIDDDEEGDESGERKNKISVIKSAKLSEKDDTITRIQQGNEDLLEGKSDKATYFYADEEKILDEYIRKGIAKVTKTNVSCVSTPSNYEGDEACDDRIACTCKIDDCQSACQCINSLDLFDEESDLTVEEESLLNEYIRRGIAKVTRQSIEHVSTLSLNKNSPRSKVCGEDFCQVDDVDDGDAEQLRAESAKDDT